MNTVDKWYSPASLQYLSLTPFLIPSIEEGARFPKSMISSGVWAHDIPLSVAHNLCEVDGTETMKSELERIGYLGMIPTSYLDNPIGAHFELHIEQGPILEKSNTKIGAVTGVQAYRWYTITVQGRDCHTGMLCCREMLVVMGM